MRLVSFITDENGANGDGDYRPGIQIDAGITEVAQVAALAGVDMQSRADINHMRSLLALPEAELLMLGETARLRAAELQDLRAVHPLETVRLGSPVPDPSKIICLGLNYRDHALEAGLTPPTAPMFFAKFANSLIGPTDPIVPPSTTRQVDYEAELAVVIGRRARAVETARALECVAGVTVFNDVSARDLQMANNLWTGGKAIDTFAPCGPALVTLDEIGDIQALPVRTRVNGETVQDGSTANMIFSVTETISFLSQIMTLEPGDIIATGTPAGVGNSRTPKLFLHTDDIVEVEIEGVGRLRNPVLAPYDPNQANGGSEEQ
jgi:acylpyruvate hydrolase